jgi:hypothetical protein
MLAALSLKTERSTEMIGPWIVWNKKCNEFDQIWKRWKNQWEKKQTIWGRDEKQKSQKDTNEILC